MGLLPIQKRIWILEKKGNPLKVLGAFGYQRAQTRL